MQPLDRNPAVSNKRVWAGRIVSALPVLFLLFDSAIKLMNDNRAVMGLNLLHWWDEAGSLSQMTDPLV